MKIRYASAFLSHSSRQKDLVRRVGEELACRGILVWLDENELTSGMDLDTELRKAADAQLVMVAFLSEASLASDWCREELEPRLRRVGDDDAIVPVFIGNPLSLVKMSRLLSERWLDPRQQRVTKLGIPATSGEAEMAQQIARGIADSIYGRLRLKSQSDVVIAVDQRGEGKRIGTPEHLVSPNLQRQDWPTLVYRPDHGERNRHEVLHGEAWTALRDRFIESTNAALGGQPMRRVYITGCMQLALAWLIGQRFDRTTRTELTVRNPLTNDTIVLDGSNSCFDVPLAPVDPSEVTWIDGRPTAATDRVSVALMSSEKYLRDVQAYRTTTRDPSPLVALEVGRIEEIRQVVEIARWLSSAVQGRDVSLYTSLPVQAVVPLAALSTKHHIGRVTFLERDMAESTYRVCEMPTL